MFLFVVCERWQILIQRDEESRDKHPVLFYKKLPSKIATMQVSVLSCSLGNVRGTKPERVPTTLGGRF